MSEQSKLKMPSIFLGHGSPMNALEKNSFTEALTTFGKSLAKPKAILSISAHWVTEGNFITSSAKPKMIYDMFGFPEELYEVQYPAAGDPQLAQQIIEMLPELKIQKDNGDWGLDHGTWSMLLHLFPKADIPVLQLSLNENEKLEYFFSLGKKIAYLREQGVLILGTGNIVHNLRKIDWNTNANVMDWAAEFESEVLKAVTDKNYEQLYKYYLDLPHHQMAHPHIDHFLPLLVVLGSITSSDKLHYIYKGFQNASISMTSLHFE